MNTVFDRDTAVTHVDDGLFAATIAPGWRAGRGPHGGYLAAILLRALTATVDDPSRVTPLAHDPLPAAPEAGPIEIRTTVERQGRSLSTLSARMEQGGRVTALALAAFSVPWEAPGANELPMPDLAPPDAERRSTPKLFKGAPEFTRSTGHAASRRSDPVRRQRRPDADRRLDRLAGASTGGRTLARPLLRRLVSPLLHCARRARDQPHGGPHDPFPPSDLRVRLRPTALCLSVFETRLLHDGLFEEDGVDLGRRRHGPRPVAPARDHHAHRQSRAPAGRPR